MNSHDIEEGVSPFSVPKSIFRENVECEPESCPVCGGDCGAANPPMYNCPMAVVRNPEERQ